MADIDKLTEDLSGRLLRLPFFNDITRDEQTRVVSAIATFLAGDGARHLACPSATVD